MRYVRVLASGAFGVSAIATMPAYAQQWSYGPHMMWDGGWWGMFFGPVMIIAFIAIVVAAVVLLVRWLGGGDRAPSSFHPRGKTPLDILKERFARGEIDKEEFEERRRILGE